MYSIINTNLPYYYNILMNKLTLTLTPKPGLDIFAQEVDNEILILDRKANKIHQLNDTASFIWKQSDGSNTISSIIESLVSVFEVSTEEAEKDVLDTIRLFQENNLLEL